MTDRSRLDADQLNELWGDVIDGGPGDESLAVLPLLADLADDSELAEQAVSLAGAIMAGASVRDKRLAASLLAATDRLLPEADDHYASLLAARLAFEGLARWPRLAEGLGMLRYDFPCPSCGTGVTVLFDHSIAKASFIDEIGDTAPLRPVEPSELDGVGRELYDTAASHGRTRVMLAVVHIFGGALCPLCTAEFSVADQVLHPAQ